MRYIKRLFRPEWPRGIAFPVAYLVATPPDLLLSHGIEFNLIENDDTGLGPVQEALMETRSGHLYGLIRYLLAGDPNYTAILVDEKLADATEVVDEVMCDLGLRSSDIQLFDLRHYRFKSCKLIREDDHGTQFVVAIHKCYPDAFFHKEKLEETPHKQFYSLQKGEE